MPNFTNLRAIDELPPDMPHYMRLRLNKRALVVLRNSRRGKWTRYAWYKHRPTALAKASDLRKHPAMKEAGELQTAVRWDPNKNIYLLFCKFDVLHVSDKDIEQNILDAGGPDVLDAEEIAETPEG